ncbi:MAG: MarR family transcriptional regulator [Candidatus Helarchaeota archaeon]
MMAEESNEDMTEEEYEVFLAVVNSGENGILPEEIAKKLKMTTTAVEQILEKFEKRGLFYSEEED